MKKLFSLLLSAAMLLNLSVPAFAEDNREHTVTATYSPTLSVSEITLYGNNFEVNESESIYTVTVPGGQSPVNVKFKVKGGNLKYVSGSCVFSVKLKKKGYFTINTASYYDSITDTVKGSVNVDENDLGVQEIQYKIGDGEWISTGKKLRVIKADTPLYEVSCNSEGNGTVTADLPSAAEGETVTLTVTPKTDYQLDKLTVTDAEGNPVPVTENTSFTMPASKVTVNATFKYTGTYTITVEPSENGTVATDPQAAAAVGDPVKLTVTPNEGYRLKSLSVQDASSNPVLVTDSTFIMPASNVTVTAIFEEMPVVSVSISWGAMSFTYDDTIDDTTGAEKGWVTDGSEKAGTVTVTNTGENTFTASVTYTPESNYQTITGSFDKTSDSLLTKDSAASFTLSLKGKPQAPIAAGTKIGSVTVTIS